MKSYTVAAQRNLVGSRRTMTSTRRVCMTMATAVVVAQPLSLSSLALRSACRASVKPKNLASQLISRTPLTLTIGSGFRVGQPLGLIGSVRHEYGYHELVASVGAHSGNRGSAGGALVYEMNVFAQIARIVKAREDPERIIDQAVEEMNTDLVKLRQTTAQVVSAKRILENKYITAQQASDEW